MMSKGRKQGAERERESVRESVRGVHCSSFMAE